MPDVGVLNLAIKDNSEQAATGLEKLAGALTRVQAAIDNGLKMSNMSRSLNTFANAVSKNSKVLSGVGTFLNAVTNYTKAFSELNNVKFNKGPIDDLKTAIGDGIKIGQAGTQLINLRTALGGDWNTENAKKAAEALKAIAKGADALQGKRVGAVASKVKALAEAFDSYTVGKNQQFGPSQEQLDELEESRQRLNAWVDEGGFSSGQRMPLYLQFFGGRGTKKSAGQLDMFEDVKSEVKEATQQYYDFRKNTEEYRYQTMNVLDIMDKPLEHLHDIYRTPTTSMEDYKNAVGAALPKVQAMSSEEMLIAGHAREATKAIDNLIKRLNEIPNPSGKGFDGVVNAMTGVASEKLPSGIINESTTMFKALEDTSDGFTKVEKATSGTITVWDEALGRHKQINFEMEKQAEVTEKVADSVGTATDEIREFIDLTKIPASGKNGTFANMSEEISYLMEQLDKAKVGMQQYSDIVAKSEKQIKYGGPMSKDELAFNVQHATEGFYQAADAEKQYQNALESAFTYAQNYKAELGSDTAKDAAMDPMTAAVEQLNTAAKDAANDGMEAFNNKIRETEKDAQSAMSKIDLYLEKVALLWGKYYEYRAMPAFDEKGESTGKFEKMNSVLIQIGRTNEQLDKMVQKAHEAQEALQFESLKAGADNMQRGYGNELVENLVNNYSEIDLLTMKMEGMKQALADDINQNRLDTDQIAKRTLAIQELKNKIDELTESQQKASAASSAIGNAFGSLFSGVQKMFPTISRMIKQFKGTMISRSIRYAIKHISAGFREGVENLYHYSNAIGTGFAPAMDQAATVAQQLKNSLGAALGPALQSLIPILQTVANWFINVINYVNQFISLITGQSTWTRALPEQASAFEKSTKSAKGASKAMKDLLADWDELNIIQSQSGNGGGSGTGKTAKEYSQMFEEVNRFDSTIRKIVDGINEQFGDIFGFAKRIGAAVLGWKVSKAFGKILGTLGGLIGTVTTLDIVFNVTAMFDKHYLDTGNAGWLVGSVLTPLIGGVFTKKILSKVLDGRFAKLAIPLSFTVSAIADIVTLIKNNDTSAISKEGLTLSAISGLKTGGAAAYLAYTLMGKSLGTSLAGGAALAITTFGVAIGIKSTVQAMKSGVTKDTLIGAAISSLATGLGAGLFAKVMGATLLGSVAFGAAAAGLTVATIAAAIGVHALLYGDKNKIQWGNYDATEEEIKAFVENEDNGVFTVNPKTILNLIDPKIEIANESSEKLTATVDEVRLAASKLSLEINTDDTLKELEEMVFGNIENGTTGLLGEFKATAKAKQTVIETGMMLVPTQDGSQKELIDKSGDAWSMLTGHMDDLGKELTAHFAEAYKEGITDEAKAMELKTIAELTQMMANVSAAITQGEQYETAMQMLEVNMQSLSQGSWSKLFTYVEEYKQQIQDAFTHAYDETTIALAGQVNGLRQSWQNELDLAENAKTEGEKKKHLSNAKAYEDEYNYWKEQLEIRRAGRQAAIEQATKNAMNEDTIARIRKILADKIDKSYIETSDVRMMDLAEDAWMSLFNANGEDTGHAEEQLTKWLDDLILAAFPDDYETIKQAISSGMLGYGDIIDQAIIDEIAKSIGVNGDAPNVQNAWNELINKLFGEEKPKVPGLDNTALDESVKDAKGKVSGMIRDIKTEVAGLDGLGFSFETTSDGGKVTGRMNVSIPKAATGGFVKSGDLVMANENGNFEMMGKMGNQPVIANNQQIVSGISQGVAQANNGVESRLTTIEGLLTRILQKEFVAKAVPGSDWGNHNVRSNDAYSRVTG